ncbi:MAG: hypothetical protein QM752_05945 [Gammaproteobacteria bacterium]
MADLIPIVGEDRDIKIAIEQMHQIQKIEGVSEAMLAEWIEGGRK